MFLDDAIREGLVSYRKRLIARITKALGDVMPPSTAESRRVARELKRLEWFKLVVTDIGVNGHSNVLGRSASIAAVMSPSGGWEYTIRYRGRILKTRKPISALVAIRRMGF